MKRWEYRSPLTQSRKKERKKDMPAIITDYFYLNSDFSFRNQVKAVNYVIRSKFNRPLFSFSLSLELEGEGRIN